MTAHRGQSRRGLIAVIATALALLYAVGCDRTRQLEGGEPATETQPVLTAEALAGEWRIVETSSDDTDPVGDPLGHAPQTTRVSLTQSPAMDSTEATDAAQTGDGGNQSALRVHLCDAPSCEEPLERFTLRRENDEWVRRYGIAQPAPGPKAANICRMRVVDWVVRPGETAESAASVERLTLEVSEVRGELTLEGEARCRGEDAVEQVDRLKGKSLSRRWEMVRVDRSGVDSTSQGKDAG
jgi:hypothetical protein